MSYEAWGEPPEYPECPTCEGTGTVNGDDDEEETCPRCDGSGYDDPANYSPLDDDVI